MKGKEGKTRNTADPRGKGVCLTSKQPGRAAKHCRDRSATSRIESRLIEGMSIATARRYLEARKKIDSRVDTIYALARMMSVFRELECDELPLDPQAIGHVGKLIAMDVCRIVSSLDEA